MSLLKLTNCRWCSCIMMRNTSMVGTAVDFCSPGCLEAHEEQEGEAREDRRREISEERELEEAC